MPEPDVVMTGLTLGESPRWHDGRLWSQLVAGQMLAVDARRPRRADCTVPTPIPFSIDWAGRPARRRLRPEGKLLRLEDDGTS